MDKKIKTYVSIIIIALVLIVIGYYFSYQEPGSDNQQGQQSEESQTPEQSQLPQVYEEPLVEEEVFTSVPTEVTLSVLVATAIEEEGVGFTYSAKDAVSYESQIRHVDSESDWMEWSDVFDPFSISFGVAGTYDIQIRACNNVGCTESNIVTVIITSATE